MQGSFMLHLHPLEVGRGQGMDWVAKGLWVKNLCSGVGVGMDFKHEESWGLAFPLLYLTYLSSLVSAEK